MPMSMILIHIIRRIKIQISCLHGMNNVIDKILSPTHIKHNSNKIITVIITIMDTIDC